jgi:hypothetical protein
MLNTKLILVDGLPGSGKSTTAQWLELQLRRNGFAAHWIHEANVPHPLWFGGIDGSRFTLPDFERTTPGALIQSGLDKWRRFTDTVRASDTIYVVESYPFLNAMGILLWGDIELTFRSFLA